MRAVGPTIAGDPRAVAGYAGGRPLTRSVRVATAALLFLQIGSVGNTCRPRNQTAWSSEVGPDGRKSRPMVFRAKVSQLMARDRAGENGAWDGLMGAAQNGDAAAYRHLLTELAVWLRRYYARRLPPGLIDDAVQESLIAVHEKRNTYDPNRPFVAWLAAIARHKWIDALRTMNAKPTEALHLDIAVADHGEAITSARTLERLLGTLKPAQSQVIRLVKLQGLSIEEASKATGQSAALVKVNIHRGLKRLTSLLRSELDET